jgi:hypothetical protein
MSYFVIFLFVVALVIAAISLLNPKTRRSKDIVSIIKAAVISILFGGAGFFLTFFIGEGIFAENEFALYASISIYNFIVCLFITRAYPKSIWFAGFFINILTWFIIAGSIINILTGSILARFTNADFRQLYELAALVIFAYAGSFVGLVLSRKKRKQVDTDQKEK